MIEIDLTLGDGRTLHAYDTSDDLRGDLAVFWLHGTPNIGTPPEPLFAAAAGLGIRWVSYDRPGYGGSTPLPGRTVASAAADVAGVADALGIDRFGVLGHSSGGTYALACGALLADRVTAVVDVSGLAPFDAGGLDWFAGMSDASIGSLRAAAAGRAAKEDYEAAEDKPEMEFAPADLAAFDGAWSWFGTVVRPALATGHGGLVADDLATVTPWGFDPAAVAAPTLLLHGGLDRVVPAAHARWLATRCPAAELRVTSDDGHISILNHAPAALEWLRER